MNTSAATSRRPAFSGSHARGDHRSPGTPLPVRAAYATLAWVVVFFAFHVYWSLGGSFGVGGEGYVGGAKLKVVGWIVEVLAVSAFPLSVWACLAIARGWPRGRMRRAAAIIVWLGCTLLAVRGGAGLIDDLTRVIGLLPNGITGLSHKQTMGAAYYRSASAIWSANITDGYFLAGGLLFGLLGYRYRASRSEGRQDRRSLWSANQVTCSRSSIPTDSPHCWSRGYANSQGEPTPLAQLRYAPSRGDRDASFTK